MVGRSRPALRAATSGAAPFPFPHQICAQFNEFAVVSADVIGFERRAIVGPEPVALVHLMRSRLLPSRWRLLVSRFVLGVSGLDVVGYRR